jgi:hypothetical protein
MSLLSDTRGTPRSVWSLAQLLAAHGGELDRSGVWGWLDPFDTGLKDGDKVPGNAVDQTIGAAASLGLIAADRSAVRLVVDPLPTHLMAFTDWVHKRLTTVPPDHPDSVLLETLAWFIASCGKLGGTTWIKDHTREGLADQIDDALRRDLAEFPQERRFNTTKYPRWRDWIAFTGLGTDLPGTPTFYPYITERLQRELPSMAQELGTGHEVHAADFLAALRRRMPYVDGGALFETAARRIGWSPSPRQISQVPSIALRELHDEGLIELKMYGDTRDAYSLAPDPTHRLAAFHTVVLQGGSTRG